MMIPISKAIKIVKQHTAPLNSETVTLADAVGRVLAEDIVADTDLPPFDRSQMDGFAVRARDTKNAPVELRILGESAAGRGWHHEMKRGEAVRIMTGAPVPKGADAVQKIELTSESAVPPWNSGTPGTGGTVVIREPANRGQFIVKKGAEVKRGEKVVSKGGIVTVNNISTLAAFGYDKVKVAKQPRVAILATGSEIVPIGKKPKRDQIRNSNSVMLKALTEKYGTVAEILPTVGDDLESLIAQIANATGHSSKTKSAIRNPQFQILIITGGVSVGKYDLTKAALAELGAEIFFERVRLKPGKPTVFARLGKTLIFGLPGNPVSAAVTFYLFVRTAITKMQNASDTELRKGYAVATRPGRAVKERDTFLPARLKTDKTGNLLAEPLNWQGSSDFIGFANAECLIFILRSKSFSTNDIVEIVFL